MANLVCTARSNYFEVKDVASFTAEMSNIGISVLGTKEEDGKKLVAICPLDEEYGGWPSEVENADFDEDDPDSAEFVEVNVLGTVAEHLAPDAIAVLQEVGNERHRYLVGNAQAVNHKGEIIALSLDDIIGLAESKFGVKPSHPSY